jgi:hypothetical protein
LTNFSLRPTATQVRQKKHICDYATCLASFKRRRDLIRHQKSKHENSKPFECNFHECKRGPGNGFSRRDHLNAHIGRVHSRHELKSLEAGASDFDGAPSGSNSQDPPIDFNMGGETATTARMAMPNQWTSTLPPSKYTMNLNTFDDVQDHMRDAGNHPPLQEYTNSASRIVGTSWAQSSTSPQTSSPIADVIQAFHPVDVQLLPFEPNYPSQMQGQVESLDENPSTMVYNSLPSTQAFQQRSVFDSDAPGSTLDDLLYEITNLP